MPSPAFAKGPGKVGAGLKNHLSAWWKGSDEEEID